LTSRRQLPLDDCADLAQAITEAPRGWVTPTKKIKT
jgi:hypothetical protein